MRHHQHPACPEARTTPTSTPARSGSPRAEVHSTLPIDGVTLGDGIARTGPRPMAPIALEITTAHLDVITAAAGFGSSVPNPRIKRSRGPTSSRPEAVERASARHRLGQIRWMRTCSSKSCARATQRVPDANPGAGVTPPHRKEAVASSISLGPDAPCPRHHFGIVPSRRARAHSSPALSGPALHSTPSSMRGHRLRFDRCYRVFVDPKVSTRPTGSMPMPCRPNHCEAKPTNRRTRADQFRASDEQWAGPPLLL